MRPFAKISDVKAGDKLKTDGGFTCMAEGEVKTIIADEAGRLFIECCDGRHALDGQEEGEIYVGLYKVEG